MAKDYIHWSKIKARVENEFKIRSYHPREIWWCSLGENIGVEIDGKNQLYQRPILVLRKFNKHMLLAIPLSTKLKTGEQYFKFQHRGKDENALLAQIRLISSKRLVHRVGRIEPQTFNQIITAFKSLLKKSEPH